MSKYVEIGLLFCMAFLFSVSLDRSLYGSFYRLGQNRIANGEWIVRIRSEHQPVVENVLSEHGLQLKSELIGNWFLVSEPSHMNEHQLIVLDKRMQDGLRGLKRDPRFLSVGYNHELKNAQWDDWSDYRSRRSMSNSTSESKPARIDLPLVYHTNDPLFARQWSLQAPGVGNLGGIDIQDAWRMSTGKSNTTIAVIDDGFFLEHDDLASSLSCSDRYLRGYNVATGSRILPKATHGTQVLGIIGACTNNRVGISAIDWRSKILPIARGATISDAILALRWSVSNPNPAQIINLSFSGSDEGADLWREVLAETSKREVVTVSSMGFSSVQEGVITVAAVDRNQVPSMDCATQTADILAPGVDVLTTSTSPNNYQFASGNSFAAPHVTGVISLMKGVYPQLNWKSARWMLKNTATLINEQCPGELNASQAVKLAQDCANGRSKSCVKHGKYWLPDIALLDLDKYVVFAESGSRSAQIKLRNVGGRSSHVEVHSSNPEIIVTPHNFNMEANSVSVLRISWPVDEIKRDAVVTFQSQDGDSVMLNVHAYMK